MGYKTTCPQCHKNNFYVTEHNHVGYCWNCAYLEKENNDPYEDVRSVYIDEIRAYYQKMSLYYHSCLTSKEINYLHARGITDKSIQDLCIGFCPEGISSLYRNSIAKEAGLSTDNKKAFLGGRITFPYICDEIFVDIRGRADHEVKYKSPFHSNYYRGADYPYLSQYLHDQVRIITEGEIKAILASQSGFSCIALAGIRSWKQAIYQRYGQKNIVCFDTQRDMKDVNRSIHAIAQRLELHVAVLPKMNKEKMDIDTFILSYGVDMFKEVINNALPYHVWKKYN